MAKYFYGIRNLAKIIGNYSGSLRLNDTKNGTIPWDKVPGVTVVFVLCGSGQQQATPEFVIFFLILLKRPVGGGGPHIMFCQFVPGISRNVTGVCERGEPSGNSSSCRTTFPTKLVGTSSR